MVACAESLVKILKQYLNHIVYIDDEFKISWPIEEKEETPSPSRKSRIVQKNVEMQQSIEKSEKIESNLEVFCKTMHKMYPEILLTPLVYEETMDVENLLIHMKNARMLVMDWKLSERMTAIQLLNKAEFSGQLRFCVIYTSNLPDAEKDFIDKIPNAKQDALKRGNCKDKSYDYIRVNSVLYMICEKDKFNFHMIMDSLVNIFIREVGYFPIAFIDMIARLERRVPYYLNEFSYPFDKLLLLQTSSDGLPVGEVSHTISNMVMNNIKTDIDLDENVLNGIYENQIHLLSDILNNDEEFKNKLCKSLDVIFDRLECTEENRSILRSISTEEYKEIIKKAISDFMNLSKGIHKASESMAKLYGKKKAEKIINENGIIGESSKVKSELIRLYKEQFKEKAEKIFPACLMVLANPEESYDVNRLVTSLKVVNYKEGERKISDIFQECYDLKEEEMCIKTDNNGPKLGLLQNKLNSGDILYKKETENGEVGTFYLCIVPSCQLLRPKKVEGNILFVEGKIVSEKPNEQLKDSEHFTILPGIDDKNKLVRVVWKYHRIVALDLNKISCSDYENLYRPYRLTYEYVRQIIGEFVAFYSKSGVEELFLKADSSLDHLLLRR